MILVTGGTGLVGSHLLLKLVEQNKKVRVVKRSSTQVQDTLKVFGYYSSNAEELFKQLEWVDVDLSDVMALEDVFEGVTEVYHCAALVSYLPQDAKKILKWNSVITANLVNAALQANVSKFCMVSSVAALGREEHQAFYHEENYWKNDPNNSTYAISKYLSEMEVWRGHEEGLNVVIVNPSLILGPGNWTRSSSTLFNAAYKGLKFYTDGGAGFVDVRDVVSAMLALMKNNIFGERYILNSENMAYKKFFTEAALAMNRKPPYIESPKWLSNMIWRVEWLRNKLFRTKPIITKETAHSAHKTSRYKNDKIVNEIGLNFIPVSKSIEEFSAFYLNDLEQSRNIL